MGSGAKLRRDKQFRTEEKDENRKKLLTGTLLALCTALLVLCSVLAIGWSKAAKTGDALPEVRNNGTAIQWKYSDEADWHDLVALTELRGAAGENGKNGTDGKDGSNGADGKNGINGTNGKDGINGVDGKDGADGKTARMELTVPMVKTEPTAKTVSTALTALTPKA